jgi:hypothetical protein
MTCESIADRSLSPRRQMLTLQDKAQWSQNIPSSPQRLTEEIVDIPDDEAHDESRDS